jgi:type II secretory pathway component PulM
MDRLLSPVKARFGELVASMTPRDRRLFVGLVVGLYAVMIVGLGWLAKGVLDDLESRIQSQEETNALVAGLAGDEETAKGLIEKINGQIEKFKDQDLQAFVEKSAQNVGMSSNLQAVRARQVITEGEIEEHTYTVDVSKVSLQQLVELLYEVETSGYPLKIRSMKTRVVTVSGTKMLNATLEVSAFKLLLAEPAATEEKPG